WQIWACLAGAVAIECAAIGVASLHKQEEIPTVADFASNPPVDAVLTELPPEPTPPPEEEPPPPPPPPTEPTEFTIEEPTPPPRPKDQPTPKPRAKMASTIRRQAPSGPVSFHAGQSEFIRHPIPQYPYEARRAHATGSGKFLLRFDSNGDVSDVVTVQSTGNAILDETSANTFRRWRAKPGAFPGGCYVPITYNMSGAQL
ncbi:MAG: TonB family protein, partial [Chthoniobacterales bacterium]